MQLNGSQIFVEVLCEQGVDTLFGYPGGAVLNLYDELYKNADRITHVLTAHEQGAAHAADGYARATGRTGVVLATSGPGATNLVTGIATAYMDSVPMVAFTGNVPTSSIGKDGFQEAYIEGITVPITKHNFTVRRVEDLADTMRAAFRIAQSGRKGPVLVDIPKDVTAAVCEFTPKQPEPIRTVTTYNEEQVHWAADLINAAQRPLVYFGGGVRSAASCQPLRDLLHKAEIPATYTLMAAGVVPYGDPMNIGMLGMHGNYGPNIRNQECDLLIAVGMRFDDRVTGNREKFAKLAQIIHIDVDGSELSKTVNSACGLRGEPVNPEVNKGRLRLHPQGLYSGIKPSKASSFIKGSLKPPELIHKPELSGLAPRVDTALRKVRDLGNRQFSCLGNQRNEVPVGSFNRQAHHRFKPRIHRLRGIPRVRKPRRGDAARTDE